MKASACSRKREVGEVKLNCVFTIEGEPFEDM